MSGYARGGGSSGAIEGPVGAESGSVIRRTCTLTARSNTSDAGVARVTAQSAMEVQDPVDQGLPQGDVSSAVSHASVATGVNAGAAEAVDSEALVTACSMPSCIEPITETLTACAPRIPHSVPLPNSESCKSNTLESAARRRRERWRGRMLEFRKPRVRYQFSATHWAHSGEVQPCCVGRCPVGRRLLTALCRR